MRTLSEPPYAHFVPRVNKLRTTPSGEPGEDAAPLPPARLRTALTVFFALDGFLFAGWVVRIPAIKHQAGATAFTLGLALLGVSAGAVITMMLTGRLCRRYGSHTVTVVCGVLLSLSIALPAQTGSALTLGLVLLLFGAAYGGMNVSMNSAAVDLVIALRRPVMPGFHAAFSFGGMAGAGLGGLVAGGLPPATHLAALTGIGLVVTAVTGPVLLRGGPAAPPSEQRAANGSEPSKGMSTRARRIVVLFGVIALCTAYGEGALAEWGALHLGQDLDASPASRPPDTRCSR